MKDYQSPKWEIRLKAVEKLSVVKSRKAENALIKATDDIHTMVRIEAINGLGKIASSKGRQRIRYLAEYDTNSNVRWNALKALSEFRDATAAPVFAGGLRSSDPLIREESIRGLLMIDDFAIKYVSIPYFIEALNDESLNVRLTALNYLNIKDERLFAILTGMLGKDIYNKYTLLKAVLKALYGYQFDPQTRKILTSYLLHPNLDIRLLALRALKKNRELQKTQE